jgi:two-component system, chemotaxis family, protein-glutamate methylesterase/glutaminase
MAYELVVIGTSLGGLEAVSTLLSALPKEFDLPIAIAQHRSAAPTDGNLAALWQRHTAMRVADADDKSPIAAGHVYVAPPDYHLLVESRGLLALSTDPPVLWARPSIDVLFQSAAEAYGESVIGVILTGASGDGSEGLRAIAARGGGTLVQQPASAECNVMPRAALAATPVNHVLELAEIGRVLGALAPLRGALR